jgi:hypothetical protein
VTGKAEPGRANNPEDESSLLREEEEEATSRGGDFWERDLGDARSGKRA